MTLQFCFFICTRGQGSRRWPGWMARWWAWRVWQLNYGDRVTVWVAILWMVLLVNMTLRVSKVIGVKSWNLTRALKLYFFLDVVSTCSVTSSFLRSHGLHSTMDSSSDHGIFKAILEWVAISFCRGSSQPRDWTYISRVSCTGKWILYHES